MPMMEVKETHPEPEVIQDDLQLFRILSGTSRIQREMGVSRFTPERTREPNNVNKLQLILTMFYLSSLPNPTPQFCYGSYSSHIDGRSCSNSFTNEEESQKMH